MKKAASRIASILLFLASPVTVLAATNCDSQAKPAFDCPTGYSMMCIPVGGDHWGCGKETAGGIEEVPPIAQAQPASDPAVAATQPTPPEPIQPAPTSQPVAAPTTAPTTAPPTSPSPQPTPTPTIAQAAPTQQPLAASPSTTTQEAPIDVPEAMGGAQETLETVAEYAPESLAPVLEAIAGTLGVVIAFLGIWEWLKRLKEKKTGKCDRCGETTGEKCAKCDGSGKIEQEYEMTVKCAHCKGSGVDPCHHCGGTGKMSLPNPPQSEAELEGWPPCDFCGGSGVKKIGAGRDWGEANDAVKNGQFACCFCKGKKSETVKLKRQVDCPDCKGTGKK
jgi:hypothetical protein